MRRLRRRTRRVSPASGKSDSATSFYQADSLTTVTNSPKPWQLTLVSERLCPAHNRVCPIRHSTAAFHEVIHGRLLVTPPFPGAWSSPRTTSSWWRMRRPGTWSPVWPGEKWAAWRTLSLPLERPQKPKLGGGAGERAGRELWSPPTDPGWHATLPPSPRATQRSDIHARLLGAGKRLILWVFWAKVSLNN